MYFNGLDHGLFSWPGNARVTSRCPRISSHMATTEDECLNGNVFQILTRLYQQVISLKCALQILSGQPSVVLPSDPRSYQDTWLRTLVACDRKGGVEDFAPFCASNQGRPARKCPGRCNFASALEGVVTASKKVT